MDADLSHPPEVISSMLECMDKKDLVVASRYIPGGKVMDWPVSRGMISLIGRLLVRPLTDVRDPMSGFFLVKRDVTENIGFRPRGFKILLDLIVRSGTGKMVEVPYSFSCRKRGRSKMGTGVVWNYIYQLASLYMYRIIK